MKLNPRQREIVVQERGTLIFYVISALFASSLDPGYGVWLMLAMWSAALGHLVATSYDVLEAREPEPELNVIPGLSVPEPSSKVALGMLRSLFSASTLSLAAVVLVLQISGWLDLSLPSF